MVGCSTLQNGKKSVLYRKPQHKTQPQHTTTNMSRRRPTLQRLWPPLSMAISAMEPNLGAAAPYGPIKGSPRCLRSRHCWFLCLGCQNGTPQKQREGQGLGLRWPPFEHTTQQPTESQESAITVGWIIGRTRDLDGTCGVTAYHRLGQ